VGKWFSHYKHNENAKINVLPVIYPFREKRMGEPMPKTVDELVRTFINENKKMLSSDFSQMTDGDILNDLLIFDLVDADLVKDEDFKRYFFPIYRADLEMFRNYIYDSNKKMEIPALVMNGTEDKMVSAERSRKWREYIGSRIEFAEFSGKYYFINDHVEEISRAISAFILKNA
jgi:surfactin synthase thioesterase subunit